MPRLRDEIKQDAREMANFLAELPTNKAGVQAKEKLYQHVTGPTVAIVRDAVAKNALEVVANAAGGTADYLGNRVENIKGIISLNPFKIATGVAKAVTNTVAETATAIGVSAPKAFINAGANVIKGTAKAAVEVGDTVGNVSSIVLGDTLGNKVVGGLAKAPSNIIYNTAQAAQEYTTETADEAVTSAADGAQSGKDTFTNVNLGVLNPGSANDDEAMAA
jgi:hypothetical protein